MTDWQPIDTVPKDGTEVLVVWNDGDTMQVASWEEDAPQPDWPWATLDGPYYHKSAFSHWTPLPEPPRGQEP